MRPCLIHVHSGPRLGLGWERGGKGWEEWGGEEGSGEERKAQRGVERELYWHRSAGSVVTGMESLFFLTQGRTPPPPLLRELTCPSSWHCFIFPTQRRLSASWALSTLILFLFILMENHEVLSGPQYNLGPLGVFRRRNLGVWWGVSERALSKPHEILCRTVSSVGAVGGGGGGPQSGEGQQGFSGPTGGLSAPPSISPSPSIRHSSFCTHRKWRQWLGVKLETSWWKIPYPYGGNRILDVKQTH